VTERKSKDRWKQRERERHGDRDGESEREREEGRKIDGETDYYNIIDRKVYYIIGCAVAVQVQDV